MSLRTESIQRVLRLEGKVPITSEMFLAASDESRGTHCQGCGSFMFYRQHRIVALVQDDMSHLLLPAPLDLQCHKCGDIYRVRIF